MRISAVSELVSTSNEAEELIAELLVKFAGTSAESRLVQEARWQHRTDFDVARQTASNLLRSFSARRSDVSTLY